MSHWSGGTNTLLREETRSLIHFEMGSTHSEVIRILLVAPKYFTAQMSKQTCPSRHCEKAWMNLWIYSGLGGGKSFSYNFYSARWKTDDFSQGKFRVVQSFLWSFPGVLQTRTSSHTQVLCACQRSSWGKESLSPVLSGEQRSISLSLILEIWYIKDLERSNVI